VSGHCQHESITGVHVNEIYCEFQQPLGMLSPNFSANVLIQLLNVNPFTPNFDSIRIAPKSYLELNGPPQGAARIRNNNFGQTLLAATNTYK
jgi:hypothetical protein